MDSDIADNWNSHVGVSFKAKRCDGKANEKDRHSSNDLCEEDT